MSEVQKNNVGTVFEYLVSNEDGAINLSTATTKQLLFRKPNGTVLTKTASFKTDGTDGYIKYVTVAGDLDTLGIWEFQSYTVIGGEEWYGEVFKFRVLRNSND